MPDEDKYFLPEPCKITTGPGMAVPEAPPGWRHNWKSCKITTSYYVVYEKL